MRAIAEHGVFCALVEMPLNLAFFDINAADKVIAEYTGIKTWYVGGHSLGGAVASIYLSSHYESLSGLVLLASYPSLDVSLICNKAISIYGSADGVLNRGNYSEASKFLPPTVREVVIDGGNHAGFGMYGEQEGDGEATITAGEQILLTAEYVTEFINV